MIWELAVLLVFIAILAYVGGSMLFSGQNTGPESISWAQESDADHRYGAIRSQLATLRLNFEPWVFAIATIMFALFVALIFLEIFPDKLGMAVLSAGGVLVFSFFLLRDLAKRRVRKFEEDLTHAIDLIHAGLQGGDNPVNALTVAGKASKKAVKTELLELVRRLELGMPIEKATERMVRLYNCEGVRLFARVLQVKWQAGGDLGELLFSVNRIIRDRVKFRLRMSAMLAGVRYSSIFIAILPYIVVPFFLWKNPVWLETLTQHPLGPQLLFGAILLQILGFFWLRNILRADT